VLQTKREKVCSIFEYREIPVNYLRSYKSTYKVLILLQAMSVSISDYIVRNWIVTGEYGTARKPNQGPRLQCVQKDRERDEQPRFSRASTPD
jgi:hypothetical protein